MADGLVMSFKFDMSWDGDTQISREILRFGDRATDARPVFRSLTDKFIRIEKGQFTSEGGRSSGGWAPLKPETVKAKKRRGFPSKILQAAKELMNSLTRKGDENMNLIISDQFMVFGSHVEHLKYHQKGTSKMPRRRVLEFTRRDRREIIREVQRFLVTGKA